MKILLLLSLFLTTGFYTACSHPTLSEGVKEAALGLGDGTIHM